ncbi:MAG: hypothetical protein ABII01_01335 [Candidatus Woesearchaeota archaeon]
MKGYNKRYVRKRKNEKNYGNLITMKRIIIGFMILFILYMFKG